MEHSIPASAHHENPLPGVNKLTTDAPYRWLCQGWEDFRASPGPSLTLGFFFVLAGYAVTLASWRIPALTLTFSTGFLLVAPVLALGFYELSRRREAGERAGYGALLYSWQKHGWSILVFGLLLGVLMVAWGRLTGLVIAVALPAIGPYSSLLSWQTLASPGFIVLYFAAGFVLAALAFGISVVSIPMLLDRRVDVLTAAMTSLRVVRENPAVMFLWAAIIALLTFVAMALGFFGLLLSMPLLGHASWHAYKEAVAH